MAAPRQGFVLQGAAELAAAFEELGRTFGGAALDPSMRHGLGMIKSAAQTNLRNNGSVQAHTPSAQRTINSMQIQKVSGRQKSTPMYRLGFAGRGRHIAHFIEFGTRPHWQPRRRSFHPGARPFPFMRPAFDREGVPAMEFILLDLREQVLKQAAKLRAQQRLL